MTESCRNLCTDPREFPKRILNRPGLPHLDFRIGSYSDFLEAMLSALDHEDILESWTHREGDDPGIALLEGASVLGDILTFYQELYANEAFLGTARWRESINDLVRLAGYSLSPGLGGKATFAFEIKDEKPVLIPAGFRIKAQVEGMEKPAEFETGTETTAYPSLGTFDLYRPSSIPLFSGQVSVFSINTSILERSGVELNEGDSLMILDKTSGSTTNAQIVVVSKIETHLDRTNITIEGSWEKGYGLSRVHAFKLGRTFRHFGHNAPPEVVEIVSGMASQRSITYSRNTGSTTSTTGDTTIQPSIGTTQIPLDSQVEDVVIGSKVVIQGTGREKHTLVQAWKGSQVTTLTWGAQTEVNTIVRTVKGSRTTTMTWGAQSGASTIINLNSKMNVATGRTDIRNLVIHETVGSEIFLYPERSIESGADGSRLDFLGTSKSYGLLHNRLIALKKEDGSYMETTATIATGKLFVIGETLRPVYLSPPLSAPFGVNDFPMDDPKVTVFGNLVQATQGKTENETVLGNGDSRQIFQTFKLPKSPLTYQNSVGGTPAEVPELDVYIDDVKWSRVSSFFGGGPDKEIYVVREDEEGNSWVQFGDGKTGKRLPSGIGNVMAVYRTGIGAYGALKEDTTVQAGSKLEGLDKIHLPGSASGGSQPETGDNAREAAPGKTQSLDRLVSLRDFETEALGIAGVSKVQGSWKLQHNVPSIILTVLMDTGRDEEIEQVRQIMASYNRARGSQRFPILVRQGSRQGVYLDVVFGLHASYQEDLVKESIMEALGVVGGDEEEEEESNGDHGTPGLFDQGTRLFGQPEYSTRIAGIVQNVDGVLWADVTAMGTVVVSSLRRFSHKLMTLHPMISSQRLILSPGKMFKPMKLASPTIGKIPTSNPLFSSTSHKSTSSLRSSSLDSTASLISSSLDSTTPVISSSLKSSPSIISATPLKSFGHFLPILKLQQKQASETVIPCDSEHILYLESEHLNLNAVSTTDMEVTSHD